MTESDPIATVREGRIRISVRPGRKKTGLSIVGNELVLSVSAQAREGRANDEVLASIATCLKVPVSSVLLLKGGGARWKTLSVSGLGDEKIRERLAAALE